MGKELRLIGQNFNPEAALQFVQRRFYVVRRSTQKESFELFVKQPDSISSNTWPPVFLTVETNGYYFCDNLLSETESSLIFKALCEFMLTTDESISVAEL